MQSRFKKGLTAGPFKIPQKNELLIRRGHSNLSPKRFNEEKLLASAIHQVKVSNPLTSPTALIYTDFSENALVRAAQLLNWSYPTKFMPFSNQIICESFKNHVNEEQRILGVFAEASKPADFISETMVEALSILHPEMRAKIAERINDFSRHGYFNVEDTVIEETPGKYKLLDIETKTLQSMQKRLRGKQANFYSKVDRGWGFGIIELNSQKKEKVKFSQTRLSFSDFEITLDLARTFIQILRGWVDEQSNLKIEDLKWIGVTTPYEAIALTIYGELMQLLSEQTFDEIVNFEDVALGWHPALTFLRFLGAEELPRILIQVDRPPNLDISLIW